jgi:hypothetical protein
MNGPGSIWLFVVLALNLGISWLNARTCGRAWEESKAIGGVIRVLVWCGAIQSAIGFSSVFLLPLVLAAHAFFPEDFTDAAFNGALSLWYITIIFPALGTGLIITIESWIVAYRERNLGNIGVAVYNTLVQIHNTRHAISSIGPAFKAVGEMFALVATSRDSAKGKITVLGVMIAVLVVATALCAGTILTAVLIHRYAGTVPLPAARGLRAKSDSSLAGTAAHRGR